MAPHLSSDPVLVFLAVLEEGSFSAAARRLRRVPSAVSMAMANLEAELNLSLFDRSGREPRPTAAALALLPQARALATQLRALEAQALALSQGLETRLTLAVDPALLATEWSVALAKLAEVYPALSVEVFKMPQGDALPLLHEGRVQLALMFERADFDGREAFREISRETFVAALAPQHPAYTTERALRLDELGAWRQIVVAGREQPGLDLRFAVSPQVWQVDDYTAAIALIREGLGWGLLPASLLAGAPGLVQQAVQDLPEGLMREADVIWSRVQPLGPAAAKLVELLTGKGLDGLMEAPGVTGGASAK